MFKDNPLEVRKGLVKAMVARMAQAYGIKKKELPTLLGCQKNAVNNWGYYGRIPYEQLDQCHEKTGVSMDWLLYGDAAIFDMTPQKLAGLQAIITQLLKDGIDFEMIGEQYSGAGKQLCHKLEKELLNWLAIVPADVSKTND
jgi:hypothetical protein